MPGSLTEERQNPNVKEQQPQDTVSQLLDNRDWGERDHPKGEEAVSEQQSEVSVKTEDAPHLRKPNAEVTPERQPKPSADKGTPEEDGKDETSSQLDFLRKKLEKTEKVLLDNQRYGRTNAQKVKSALKIAQKMTEDGLLDAEEAKGLLDALQSEEEDDGGVYPSPSSPARLFAPIFKVANKELENIRKYTEDDYLQDKVEAFDWFLSTSSEEERQEVLEELTELLGNPVKLARKMLSIGQETYEGYYKAIRQAGGFKNYLSTREQDIEKLQKKIDKLEKKLLQYEDFDKPSWRLDEMMEASPSPSGADTISALFDERDRQWRSRKETQHQPRL